MKKFILSIAVFTLSVLSTLSAQTLTQASVERTSGLEVTIYVKPNTTVNSATNLNITFAVSLPGASGPATLTGISLVGGTITGAATEIIAGRKVYPYVIDVPSSTVAFPANVSTPFAKVTFPASESGDIVQLNDYTASNTDNAFWYISYNGIDGTNYPEKFYGTNAVNGPDSRVEIAQPLPITLISFNAEKSQERNSYLTWSTASEINSSHFVIQRSSDKRAWTNVGKVEAAGESQVIQNYEFIDANVYNGTDARLTVFYRLQLVDLDNQSKTSTIESVVFTGAGSEVGRAIIAYPNPSSDGLQVTWDASRYDQPTSLEFFDTNGKLIYKREVSDNTNQEYIDFSQTNIIPGLYILRILSDNETIDHKQIVVDKR